MIEKARITAIPIRPVLSAMIIVVMLIAAIGIFSGCQNSNASGSTVTGRALRFPSVTGVPFIRMLLNGDNAVRFQVTDSNGSYTMFHVPTGTYQVKYARFGFLVYSEPLVIDENGQTYVVDLPEVIAGVNVLGGLIDDSEGPLQNAEIWLVYQDGGIAFAATNEDGEYTLNDLPEGAVKVVAIAPDHLPRMAEDVQIGFEGINELDFELEVIPDFEGAVVMGTVTTSDGEALEDSYVGIFHDSADPSLYMVARAETLSDSDGYILEKIPAGIYTVICTHSGYALDTKSIVVDEGGEYTMDFVLDSEEYLWQTNQSGY